MTRRQELTSRGPSIKQMLEALSEEERREAAASTPPPMLRPVPVPTAHHYQVTGAPSPSAAHPAHAAHAALVAQANGWSLPAQQPVTDIEFEHLGGGNVATLNRAVYGNKLPRRALTPPPALIAIDIDEPRFDDELAVEARDPRHDERTNALQLLQSHVRVPWIARHVFTAAGALAIILPCAYYLTAPVIDRMSNRTVVPHSAGTIAQRGVPVTDVNGAPAAATQTKTQQAASDMNTGLTHAAATSLGSLDQYASGPGSQKPAPPDDAPASMPASHASAPVQTAAAALTDTNVSAPSTKARAVAVTPGWQAQTLALSHGASRTMTPERAAALLARGRELAANRDITAARKYFERAAEGGSPQAALEAGRTYDPVQLKELGIIGLKADPQRAGELYRQADAAGVAGARALLEQLAAQ